MFLLALVIAIVAIVLIKICMKKSPKKAEEGGYTVYGTMGCGWTRKQLEYMKQSGTPFTFVDCDSEECAGITAFPTTVDPSGEQTVGFKKF